MLLLITIGTAWASYASATNNNKKLAPANAASCATFNKEIKMSIRFFRGYRSSKASKSMHNTRWASWASYT